MKINGKTFSNVRAIAGPYPIERIIDGKKTVFGIYAQPVWSYDEFNRLYPRPQPPVGGWSPSSGGKKSDEKNPQYLQDLDNWTLAREGWSIMKSLEPSNIELDDVDMKDPRTWHLIVDRLQGGEDGSTGMFSYFEYNAIIGLMDEACGIDKEKVAVNRESFLSEQQAQNTATTKV